MQSLGVVGSNGGVQMEWAQANETALQSENSTSPLAHPVCHPVTTSTTIAISKRQLYQHQHCPRKAAKPFLLSEAIREWTAAVI